MENQAHNINQSLEKLLGEIAAGRLENQKLHREGKQDIMANNRQLHSKGKDDIIAGVMTATAKKPKKPVSARAASGSAKSSTPKPKTLF